MKFEVRPVLTSIFTKTWQLLKQANNYLPDLKDQVPEKTIEEARHLSDTRRQMLEERPYREKARECHEALGRTRARSVGNPRGVQSLGSAGLYRRCRGRDSTTTFWPRQVSTTYHSRSGDPPGRPYLFHGKLLFVSLWFKNLPRCTRWPNIKHIPTRKPQSSDLSSRQGQDGILHTNAPHCRRSPTPPHRK